MREIKFRGYNKENKKWLKSMTIIKDKDKYFIMLDELQDGVLKPTLPVEEASIGQYTGFKDRNGKEIYDGDIVKYEKFDFYKMKPYITQAKVYFDNKLGAWMAHEDRAEEVNSDIRLYSMNGKVEVIGNIYEDKLKEGK